MDRYSLLLKPGEAPLDRAREPRIGVLDRGLPRTEPAPTLRLRGMPDGQHPEAAALFPDSEVVPGADTAVLDPPCLQPFERPARARQPDLKGQPCLRCDHGVTFDMVKMPSVRPSLFPNR